METERKKRVNLVKLLLHDRWQIAPSSSENFCCSIRFVNFWLCVHIYHAYEYCERSNCKRYRPLAIASQLSFPLFIQHRIMSTTATLRALGFSVRCTGANMEFTCNGHTLAVLGPRRTYACIGNGFYVIAANKQEKSISSHWFVGVYYTKLKLKINAWQNKKKKKIGM